MDAALFIGVKIPIATRRFVANVSELNLRCARKA